MVRQIAVAVLVASAYTALAQSGATHLRFDAFEVATVKPVAANAKSGRFIKMEDMHRFIERDYTLKLLIAAAYDLNPRTVSGGPGWIESEHYDIVAVTPGAVRPTHDEQMAMLRSLLAERFSLRFHREPKQFSIYALEAAKSGPKLKESTVPADVPAALISTVYPQRILLPARNATMAEFVSMMQRAILDRPVVDRTGLSGRYDFDLEWAPDETQFGGDVSPASSEATAAPLFSAIQQQLGLRFEATRGTVEALVIDGAERPTAN